MTFRGAASRFRCLFGGREVRLNRWKKIWMTSIPTIRPVMKLSGLHIGQEEQDDQRNDDDEA